ncbi:hypothetical protein AFLA_013516 [Aspergillus flavus NRRL3357]|nr:hypothetical protein AFLA_013516 [Aspergillus flavus NRRL3357]
MLRRKPTAIAITSEDLATFEDTRLRKFTQENKDYDHVKNSFKFDPIDALEMIRVMVYSMVKLSSLSTVPINACLRIFRYSRMSGFGQ